MRSRSLFLIPLALAAAAAVPPGDPANLDTGAIAMRPSNAPVSLNFDDFPFGNDKSGGRIDVDVDPLHGVPPIVIEIGGWRSGQLSTIWVDSFLHDHGFRFGYLYAVHGQPKHDGAALAASYANGIAALLAKADRRRFDPHRIILMGSGIGGDLAALLGTDPTYLQQAGVPFKSLRGVILFDGAGFDLPGYLPALNHYWRKPIEEALGKDPELQARISAIRHVEPPNAPAFQFETVKGDSKSEGEAETMAAALRKEGTAAEVVPVSPSRENDPSTDPGHPTSPANDSLLRFVRTAMGRP